MLSISDRLRKQMGTRGIWRAIGRLHIRLYRLSGGRFGNRTGSITQLLLTTTGCKSGQPRTAPLTFMEDGERFVLVASNGGADRPPAWYLNLTATPQVVLETNGQRLDAEAYEAAGEERDRLWQLLSKYNPQYVDYERFTDRRLPIIVCTPVKD